MQLAEHTKKLQAYIKNNLHPECNNEEELREIYQEFVDCITDHNHLYYIQSQPIISDKEYDELFDYLKKIEEYHPHLISSDSPTQKLINQIQKEFKQENHKKKLLSLENSYNSQDIKEWSERIEKILEKENITEKIQYYIEPKFDGLSIELVYENGVLNKAITRGDGIIGEDVTKNVKTIKNIPNKIDSGGITYIVFRGEVVISQNELTRINNDREKKGLNLYANTRNLASGSLKQLDSNVTASRNLECYVYDKDEYIVSAMSGVGDMGTTMSILGELHDKDPSEFGFQKIRKITFSSISDVIDYCDDEKTKEDMAKEYNGIELDGLVIKIKNERFGEKTLRQIIGSTAHHPRRAIAYKFPAQQISTQITSVDFQVGRTGIVTPVANLDPVQLSGAMISRVSLHNFDFIKTKDIHHHDYIWIQRSGEVIPYIVGTIKERREKESQEIIPPTHCPVCAHEITNVDIHYYCPNPECPAQIKEKIIYFVSKGAMDIEGIGESIIDILVDQNIVHNIADLYTLLDFETERIVKRFPGFADKKISEIKKQLEESKNKPFWRLLNGLGIPGIGKKTAQDIEKALSNAISTETACPARSAGKGNGQGEFHRKRKYPGVEIPLDNKKGSLDKLEMTPISLEGITTYLTDEEFLINIYGIGGKIVQGIITYFETHKQLLQRLEHLGLKFSPKNGSKTNTGGEHFCITGSFDIPRPKIIEAMEQHGYIFDTNPIQTTTYMLVGSKPGGKLSKAEESGCEIIQGWEKIIENFSFLKKIEKNEKKNNGPEQRGLF